LLLLSPLVFQDTSDPSTALFLLIISALWFGTSNSAREIVSEKAIYVRERMVNLRIHSYVFSKYTVLGLLCLIQCFMLVVIVHPALDLNGHFLMNLLVTFMASLAGLSIGLFISTITRTQQAAAAIVPLILIPMVVLGGGMFHVKNMNDETRALSYVVPSRWAYEHILHVEEKGKEHQDTYNEAVSDSLTDNPQPDDMECSVLPAANVDKVHCFFGDYKQEEEVLTLIMTGFIAGFLGLTMVLLKRRDKV